MSLSYRPEIDGLRSVAVLPVILFHAGLSSFSGGYVGVDVFFVISGYLITSILLNDIDGGRFSILRFYERRVRRILPALFLVMAVSVPAAMLLLRPNDLIDFAKSLIAVPLFLSNVLFWAERGYFDAATDLKPLVHTWSLAVEEQFYILYPPLLYLMARAALRWRALVFGGLFALSLAASWYLTRLHFETGFYLPFSRAWELLSGAGAAVVLRRRPGIGGLAGTLAAGAGLLLVLWAVFTYDAGTVFPGIAAVPVVFGTVLLILAAREGNPVHRVLAWRPLVWIGLLSYSLYLWHQPIFVFIRHAGGGEAAVLASLPLVLAASVLSYRLVEQPLRRAGASRRRVFGLAAAASLAFIAIGAWLVASGGLIARYSAADRQIIEQYQDQAAFSETRFNAREFRPFDGSGRIKVLLTGDSHARDLLGIALAAGMDETHQFSTKRINAGCGNLYTERVLEEHISDLNQERCKVMGRFEAVQDIAAAADEIWLHARWFPWVVEYLPETIENLENDFGARIRVFGSKNFGEVTEGEALAVPEAERAEFTQPVAPYFYQVNERMKEILPKEIFVDILAPFCGGDTSACHTFTPSGELITSDGGHLLRAGAEHLAPIFLQLLRAHD